MNIFLNGTNIAIYNLSNIVLNPTCFADYVVIGGFYNSDKIFSNRFLGFIDDIIIFNIYVNGSYPKLIYDS